MIQTNSLYKGGHLQSKENFTYGKFECYMKPSFGSGIISSAFLFYDGSDFRTNWQELDLEVLGKNSNLLDTNIIQTVNGYTDKNGNVKHHLLNKRSSDVFWKLTIEWLPTSVTWKVNDVVVRVSSITLSKPMKFMLNNWMSGDANWAGGFSPGLLPQVAQYEYVRISRYVGGRFVFAYQEDFTTLDLNRWMAGTWTQGNTQLVKECVTVGNSKLSLLLKI